MPPFGPDIQSICIECVSQYNLGHVKKVISSRAKQILCFDNSRTQSEDLASKTDLSPLVALAAARFKTVVLLLLIHCLFFSRCLCSLYHNPKYFLETNIFALFI